MKVKEWNVVEMCVEEGIQFGYAHAHKHTDTPTENQIKEEIFNAIMLNFDDWFEFDHKIELDVGDLSDKPITH